ncbi:MAG: hypothetical protein E7178_03755 [Erysipelotrichaceae bacterium]|jgi:elongation factor P--beta-lysine ligase|nr:hypothetical protein [Erysipelotrichaceae bacterium]
MDNLKNDQYYASKANENIKTINYHLKKLFSAAELNENQVVRNFRITATDGYHNRIDFLSLNYYNKPNKPNKK